jgi:hypothetical protein
MPTWATIFTHWKSSVQGLLVFITTTCGVLTASGMLNANATKYVALASALGFAYIGIISKDSGVQVATVAGVPQAVTSHEVPDDPTAVVKGKNV